MFLVDSFTLYILIGNKKINLKKFIQTVSFILYHYLQLT